MARRARSGSKRQYESCEKGLDASEKVAVLSCESLTVEFWSIAQAVEKGSMRAVDAVCLRLYCYICCEQDRNSLKVIHLLTLIQWMFQVPISGKKPVMTRKAARDSSVV
eukprot:767751-Hanusia_phi.AAC.2